MLSFILLQAASPCIVNTAGQTGGITTCSVQSITQTIKPGELITVTSNTTVAHPYICKDGSRPELPNRMISKCRAEFLGGLTIRGWTGPFPGE